MNNNAHINKMNPLVFQFRKSIDKQFGSSLKKKLYVILLNAKVANIFNKGNV